MIKHQNNSVSEPCILIQGYNSGNVTTAIMTPKQFNELKQVVVETIERVLKDCDKRIR